MGKKAAITPILNSLYIEPAAYYVTNEADELDLERIPERRRPFIPDTSPVPVGQGAQKHLIDMEARAGGGPHEKYMIHRVHVEGRLIFQDANSEDKDTNGLFCLHHLINRGIEFVSGRRTLPIWQDLIDTRYTENFEGLEPIIDVSAILAGYIFFKKKLGIYINWVNIKFGML